MQVQKLLRRQNDDSGHDPIDSILDEFRGQTYTVHVASPLWHGGARTGPWVVVIDQISYQMPDSVASPEQRWTKFLATLPTELGQSAEDLWRRLRRVSPFAVPPSAALIEDDQLLSMTFARHGRFLEIELRPSGTYDWFYRDQKADIAVGDRSSAREWPPNELTLNFRQMFS